MDNQTKPIQNQSVSDRPVSKKDTRRLAWLIAGLILITTLLLLCIIPGHPALGVFLKLPQKAPSIITSLEPISFAPVSPPAGGGPANIEFPIGSSLVVNVPTDLTTIPGPTPTPVPTQPACITPAVSVTNEFSEAVPCPAVPPPTTPPQLPPPGPQPPTGLMDRGDAPDKPTGGFPSLAASKGARHIDISRFYLGKRADVEADSYQVDKDSPDAAVGPDDGLTAIATPGVGGGGAALWSLIVEIHNNDWPEDKPIYLNALYDYNFNLTWDVVQHPEEHVVVDKEFHIPPGQSAIYAIPVIGIKDTLHWLRLTVTDIKLGQNYNGSWPTAFNYGETEDYFREYTPPSIIHNPFFSDYYRPPVHLFGDSEIVPRPSGPNTFVPVEQGGQPGPKPGQPIGFPTYDSRFFTHDVTTTKLTPRTPTAITTAPAFDPNKIYKIDSIIDPKTGKPVAVAFDPASGVYKYHDGVTTKFGDPADDGFLKTHDIPPVPKPKFNLSFPSHGTSPIPISGIQKIGQVLNVDLPYLLGEQNITLSIRYHPNFVNAFTSLKKRTGAPTIFQRIVETIFQPVPVPTAPSAPGSATPQYKLEVVSVNTSTGEIKIRALGSPDGNNEVILTAYSKSGTRIQVTNVPFDVASVLFNYVAPSGAVSIQAQVAHNGNPVPGAIATFPSVALITASGGGSACHAITINDTLADGTANTAYTGTVLATGGTASYTYAVTSGSLPTGLSLSASGSVTGTPTVAGTYTFTITATDANSCTGTNTTYSMTIASACPTVSFSPATFPNGQDNRTYNQSSTGTLTSGTGTGSSQALNMPPGVDLNISGSPGSAITWQIVGTPLGAGTYSFTARIAVAGCSNLDTPFTWIVTP